MSGLELGPGDTYGAFQIGELLGRGAFAAVYRVRTQDRATAALAVLVAWPLLFWGKPVAGSSGVNKIQPPVHYRTLHQQEAVW